MHPQNPNPGGGTDVPPPDPNLIFVLNLLVFGAAGYWLLGAKQKAVIAAVLWVAGLTTCGVVISSSRKVIPAWHCSSLWPVNARRLLVNTARAPLSSPPLQTAADR